MGASFGTDLYTGDADAAGAYEALVRQAHHDHGYDPYNGSISTSSGFKVHRSVPVTLAEAYRLAETLVDTTSKWGDWYAIAIGETETATKTVKASGTDRDALLSAANAKAPAGWAVRRSEIISWERTLRAVKTTPMPAATTVWVAKSRLGTARFASKAEAVAYAKELVTTRSVLTGTRAWDLDDLEVTIRKTWADPDGADAAFTVAAPTAKLTATVELELERLSGTRRTGWLFCGWAAI